MKPRVFIGSSKEGLDIAYALQESLQHDAVVTVWTQGIFQLSSNALTDLISALNDFDFAIMVFRPDDISVIRNIQSVTVRDNVVFELGLFMGKLGRDKVFFVIPSNEKNFHIPTDLTGVTAGTYDAERGDNNLIAALGPFCNQIRVRLKAFIHENLSDLTEESADAKKIAIERPFGWEYLLAAELIENRLEPINRSYQELEKNLFFIQTLSMDADKYRSWFTDRVTDLKNLCLLFTNLLSIELNESFGPPGVAGKAIDIKNVADKFQSLGKSLIAWEYAVQEAQPPEGLEPIKNIMKGWSRTFMDELNKLPSETRRVIAAAQDPLSSQEEKSIKLTIQAPGNMDLVVECFQKYYERE